MKRARIKAWFFFIIFIGWAWPIYKVGCYLKDYAVNAVDHGEKLFK